MNKGFLRVALTCAILIQGPIALLGLDRSASARRALTDGFALSADALIITQVDPSPAPNDLGAPIFITDAGFGTARSAIHLAESTEGIAQSTQGPPVVLRADPRDNPFHIPPPIEFTQTGIQSVQNTTIIVNYTGTWNAEAQAAFQYAADLWETQITSQVPIVVDAQWAALLPGVLGQAGPAYVVRNFSGAPVANTWYAAALANKLRGTDLYPSDADIDAEFNSSFPSWYFGTDGNPPSGQYDFVSVVLHELGHGLGFGGSMDVASGQGSWGYSGYPMIYDRFAENGSGQSLINTGLFPNPSAALAAQLTSDNVYFDAPATRVANGGTPVKLYAPDPWNEGSSYSHLDEIYNNTPNALMTYSIGAAEAIHDPGPIARAMFQDIGWTIPGANAPPTLSGLPDLTVPQNGGADNAIDLWIYADDAEDADNALTFTLGNTPDANAGVAIDSNRYIDVQPTAGWTGTTQVTIRVMDTGSLTDTDTFQVIISAPSYGVYLPTVLKSWPPIVSHTYIASTDDTTLRTIDANTWYGDSSYLVVGYGPDPQLNYGIARSILRFDLSSIPAGMNVQSATLQTQLYAYAYRLGHPNAMTISAYRINQAWPASPTWNSFANAYAEHYGSVSVGTTFTWYSLDVTALVQGWVNSAWPNYGIMLRGQESSYDNIKRFYSANGLSSYRPRLVVYYADPTTSDANRTAVIPAMP